MISLDDFITIYHKLLEISKESVPQIDLSRLWNLYNVVQINGGWYETISRNNWHEISHEDDAWMLYEATSLVKLEALLNYSASLIDQESINSQHLTAEINESANCIIMPDIPGHPERNESIAKRKHKKRHKSMHSVGKITWRNISPIVFAKKK